MLTIKKYLEPTRRKLLTFLPVLLYSLLLLPLDTGQTEIAKSLTDAGHGPLFAVVAIILLLGISDIELRTIRDYGAAFGIAITLGIVGEIAQWLFTTTRHAQAKDILMDACGAIAGLCLFAQQDQQLHPGGHQRRVLSVVALLACLTILAPVAWNGVFYIKRWIQAPELVTFDSTLGYHFLHAGNAEMTFGMVPPHFSPPTNKRALRVTPQSEGRWSGITLEEPLPDWRAYNFLEIEVINPNDAPLELLLRIDDRDHNQEFTDRFNRTLFVDPKQRAVLSIALSDIKQAPATRQMALDAMARLVLFQDTQRRPQAFYLCGLRLRK